MAELIIIGVVLAVISYVWLQKKQDSAGSATVQANLPGPGEYAYSIAGASNYQDALQKICGDKHHESTEHYTEAILHFENDNKYDPMAVRVAIEGRTVGYLRRSDARNYRRQVLAMGHGELTCRCKAKIVGGWYISEEDQGSFGVRLDLPTE